MRLSYYIVLKLPIEYYRRFFQIFPIWFLKLILILASKFCNFFFLTYSEPHIGHGAYLKTKQNKKRKHRKLLETEVKLIRINFQLIVISGLWHTPPHWSMRGPLYWVVFNSVVGTYKWAIHYLTTCTSAYGPWLSLPLQAHVSALSSWNSHHSYDWSFAFNNVLLHLYVFLKNTFFVLF